MLMLKDLICFILAIVCTTLQLFSFLWIRESILTALVTSLIAATVIFTLLALIFLHINFANYSLHYWP
jgi:hypothetical protein